ncbi:hypothetical protein OO010_09925 [Flavobacteriaceae bacterium KMM 6898]|nr:hypothetical protein [Flavobacteriaceae bacterium KMM 6898]
MKLYVLLLVFTLPMIGCAQRTADVSQIKSIAYTASTRGFYLNIEINEENIYVERSREGDKAIGRPFSDEEWKHLITLISEFDIRKLDKMASPSQKSQVDAAAIANLEVETENHLYSCSFDHSTPPQPLKRLMEYMLTLSESVE